MTDVEQRIQRIALIALLTGAVAIAFSGIFVRLSETGPVASAFYRVFLALPALLALTAWERRSPEAVRPRSLKDYWHLTLAGLFFAGDLVFWHWSLTMTTVTNATLLANFVPIFVTLGAFLFFAQRFNRMFLAGMVLAIIGAVVLMSGSVTLSLRQVQGDAFGLITAVFYAGYILTVGKLRGRFGTATVMFYSGVVTAVVLAPLAVLSNDNLIPLTLHGWAILLALALFSHVGGQGLIAYALRHLPAAFGSVALLMQPACAALLAWYLLGEALGWLQAFGGIAVLIGVYLARLGSRAPKPTPVAPKEKPV